MSSQNFRTRSIDLAAFLRYALPPGSHLATTRGDDGRLVYSFDGLEQCRELADTFFGTEPVAVGDIKAYNDANREIRATMRAVDTRGKWRKGEDNE